MARLFVGLWPPEEILDRIAALPHPAVDGLRWTTREQWHVTLQFLGEVSQSEIEARLARERWSVTPFRLSLGPRTTLLGRDNLVLPAEGAQLNRLASAVGRATGVDRTNRFRGHLTLARARNRVPRERLAQLEGMRLDAEWTADRLALVRSTLAPGGARYETVGEYPLGR